MLLGGFPLLVVHKNAAPPAPRTPQHPPNNEKLGLSIWNKSRNLHDTAVLKDSPGLNFIRDLQSKFPQGFTFKRNCIDPR